MSQQGTGRRHDLGTKLRGKALQLGGLLLQAAMQMYSGIGKQA